jgi:hypothetical protein
MDPSKDKSYNYMKNLAKKKNIKIVDHSKKPKTKETLVMELLNH